MWYLSLPIHILWGPLIQHPLHGFTLYYQRTDIHVKRQYIWNVLYYQLQLNQYLIPSFITYIGQLVYPHISWVCHGVNVSKCPPT